MRAPTFVILVVCFASTALAEDLKTNDGTEYKNVTVTRVEPDGVVLSTSSGISKVYFSELPKDIQERFHYDPEKAAAANAAQMAAIRQANELAREADELDNQRRKAALRYSAEQQAKQRTLEALADRLNDLQQQEESLLVQIGQATRAEQMHRAGGLRKAARPTPTHQKRSYLSFEAA
jgi:hypothetical protein